MKSTYEHKNNKEEKNMKKLAQAAEAIIYKQGDVIEKDRINKNYRIKEIDENIRKKRTSLESNILLKARRNGVNVPLVREKGSYKIRMDFVSGKQVKDVLNKNNYESIVSKIAKQVSFLHDAGIVHADLTTSNMIYNRDVFLIDFGLAQNSSKIEDKAVDVYLLRQALQSKHHEIYEVCFEIFVKNYKSKDSKKVMERVEIIDKRRRYKGH